MVLLSLAGASTYCGSLFCNTGWLGFLCHRLLIFCLPLLCLWRPAQSCLKKCYTWVVKVNQVFMTLLEDPDIPLLGIYPEDSPACNKDTCSTMFIAALLVVARSWKETRCPSVEKWIQKMWYICTMEYYSAIRNNEFMNFLDKWMELENIILSEVTQSQKINHGMHSLISRY